MFSTYPPDGLAVIFFILSRARASGNTPRGASTRLVLLRGSRGGGVTTKLGGARGHRDDGVGVCGGLLEQDKKRHGKVSPCGLYHFRTTMLKLYGVTYKSERKLGAGAVVAFGVGRGKRRRRGGENFEILLHKT